MNKKEFLKRSLDTTNGFFSTQAAAVAVNPNIWDFRLREYEEKNLVITPQAEQFDFRGPGSDYKVTIDNAPSAAADLVETVNVGISSFSTRNVLFEPTERGAAYQLTRKEAVRAFFNVAERMVTKLGYSLAQRKDELGVTTIYNGATHQIFANSKAASTALASTDTLNYADILRSRKLIIASLYRPMDMFISPTQEEQLLNLGTIHKANEFGTRQAIQNGLIGTLFGLQIWSSHSIAETANRAKAIVAGRSRTGERAFGYAIKRDPIIEREYHARGRYWDIVAHEEYDFKVLHPDALVVLETYV